MSSKGQNRAQLTKEQLEKLFVKLDLNGIEDRTDENKEEVWKLIEEFSFLFALNDLDLGKISIVKHTIKLTDYTPFKERYHRMAPHQFEEVTKHLQEMLEIGAIKYSNSPQASAVVLVQKRMVISDSVLT